MKVVTFNANDEATVTLTAEGAALLNGYYTSINWHAGPARAGEIVRMPIWEMMHVFGPGCGMGIDPPFRNNRMTVSVPEESTPATPSHGLLYYTGLEQCIKCGHSEASPTYQKTGDWLTLTCGRCRYSWNVLPLSACPDKCAHCSLPIPPPFLALEGHQGKLYHLGPSLFDKDHRCGRHATCFICGGAVDAYEAFVTKEKPGERRKVAHSGCRLSNPHILGRY